MSGDQKNRIKIRHRVWGMILFIAYLILLTYFLFFSDDFGRTGREVGRYVYNLTPFKEIKRFFIYRESLGIRAYIINIYGNIAALMPFGFFLPIIGSHKLGVIKTVICGAAFSLLIETVQLITFTGSFDVDDIILNTIGVLIGYIIFKIVLWITRRGRKNV